MKEKNYGKVSDKSIPEPDGLLKQEGNGTMDYNSKQEKFEREDKAKLNKGGYKDSRY